jgi:hypothetical protein
VSKRHARLKRSFDTGNGYTRLEIVRRGEAKQNLRVRNK